VPPGTPGSRSPRPLPSRRPADPRGRVGPDAPPSGTPAVAGKGWDLPATARIGYDL